MNDLVKGILAGGWSLVAGWILPTAINTLIVGFFVLPSLQDVSMISDLAKSGVAERALAVIVAAIVCGLILNALQVPLYRVLEGYLWPAGIARRRQAYYVRLKHRLQDRLEVIRLQNLNDRSRLKEPDDQQKLAKLLADQTIGKYAKRDQARTVAQRSLLRERVRRYPVDDAQVAPTRLGNAIRRLEEYGYNRYRLDSQALWYELTATAPKQLNQQVDTSRTGVDFFICLLYGQLLAAVAALTSLAAPHPHYLTLLVTAIVLIALTPAWYRLAWITTDDWALAVRALVDLGRKPLAEGLGLCLPDELQQERKMWNLYCRMVRRPYESGRYDALNEFRSKVEHLDQNTILNPGDAGEQLRLS